MPLPVRLPAPFLRLAWSNLAAQSAEQVALVAAPIVAVVALGAGEAESGLLQIALTLPFLLFALPAGLLADRVARPRLMACAEALRAVSLVSIGLLLGAGQLSLWLLALLGFVGAGATVIYSVAAPALVPALVPPALLSTANARVELARTLAFTAGPALGGALVGWTGAGLAFGLAAVLSVMAFILLSGLREEPRPAPPAPSPPAGGRGRHRVRGAPSPAAAGSADAVPVQRSVLRARRGLLSLRGPPSRPRSRPRSA